MVQHHLVQKQFKILTGCLKRIQLCPSDYQQMIQVKQVLTNIKKTSLEVINGTVRLITYINSLNRKGSNEFLMKT